MSDNSAASPAQARVGIAMHGARAAGSARLAATALRVRLEAFCVALEHATALSVSGHAYKDYASVLKAITARSVDFAWLPPLVAIRAMRQKCASPVLLPIRGGSSVFWSALFCRSDSPIQGLGDLSGRRIAWVDRSSAAGYQVMRAWLRTQGVDVEHTFSREGFVSSHDAVVGTVLGGKADVGATYAHVDSAGKIVTASWREAPVRVLALAGPIPSDVLAAGSAVDPETVGRVAAALTGGLDGELRGAALALFEADRFERATSLVLEPLVAFAEAGMD